ncbi:MAG: putative lipid II flippase FtsW [Synergistaceae bacterium]|jgi:cell division protein FtsW|nr:putative lipid II flippase FtsW [Synergistaceae bacterium]
MRAAEDTLGERCGAFKTDPLLWLIPLVLSGIGILMVTSTTSRVSYELYGTSFTTGMRQLKWLAVGGAAMLATYSVPVSFWRRIGGALWLLSLLFVAVTLVPGIGTAVGGARRWIRMGGVSVQTSEVMIFATALFIAKFSHKNELNPHSCFAMTLSILCVSSPLLLLQPDLGSTILMMMICMGMYVERFGWKLPLTAGGICAALLVLLIAVEPYRLRRVNAYFNPWEDPLDSGFQTIQGLIAFANGGILGSGLGHGFQKLQYLPAASTDFIYAALGEELGLPGTLGVLTLCLMWLGRCRSLYNHVEEGFDTALAWGISLTIILPFCINIAGVTNMIPLTGMPLPFISYGGSSLVMMWMRVGILLRLCRKCREEEA